MAPGVEVPEGVEKLIRHGLAKRPDERVPSAKAYIQRIDEIIAEEQDSGSGLREVPARVVEGLRGTVTPAVVRAVSKTRSKKQLVLALLGVLGLVGMLAFVFGDSKPDYLPRDALSPLVRGGHGPEAKEAADMLAQGRPKEAAAYLMGHREEVREEPYAQMVLGHAQAAAQRNILALAAYDKAVTLEPKFAKDRLMRTNVELMLAKKAPGIVDAALALLGVLAKTGDWAATDQLVDLASSSKNARRRHTALRVADEAGLADRVDRLGSYLLDLEQGETCLLRKDAVGKLRALGDKKAIPELRKARKRIRTEGAVMKRKVNTNACLKSTANEAIRYLQSL
jgi:hypothetical protein